LMTVTLAVWTVVQEQRPSVRALGIAMLIAVVLQGVLGGVTVLYKLPLLVSVTHACLAQTFFCLAVTMAVVTGRAWGQPRPHPVVVPAPFPAPAAAPAAPVWGRRAPGPSARHMGAGLAIPASPLASGRLVPPLDTPLIAIQFAHRMGAVVVASFV